ncbi:hypothetical protein HJFPF1_03745 [Paramyrothecium foliicola]|nr:hypothetical protein HJFPF1_03745 [Paramyrothecium foliicola]
MTAWIGRLAISVAQYSSAASSPLATHASTLPDLDFAFNLVNINDNMALSYQCLGLWHDDNGFSAIRRSSSQWVMMSGE